VGEEQLSERTPRGPFYAQIPVVTSPHDPGYAKHVSANTRGRALSIRFARYEEAPPPHGEWGGDEPGITANKPTRTSFALQVP
jgi:hypothetical protein